MSPRSIVPRVTRGGVGQVDDAKQNDISLPSSSSAADSEPALHRRVVRRRVVRGAGAAGAAVALKVEERESAKSAGGEENPDEGESSAASEEKKTAARRSASTSRRADSSASNATARRTRTRTRSRVRDDEEQGKGSQARGRSSRSREFDDDTNESSASEPSRRTGRSRSRVRSQDSASASEANTEAKIESAEERVIDAVEGLPKGHESRHTPRPMTSLLFQEPVLPGEGEDDDEPKTTTRRRSRSRGAEDDGSDDRRSSRSARGNRSRRVAQRVDEDDDESSDERRGRSDSRSGRSNDSDRGYEEDNEDSSRTTRRSRRSNDDDIYDEEAAERTERRTHRRRRLNAEERHAADEVEQIEEDLEDDDITYRPIDDVEAEQSATRTRRGRGGDRSNDRSSRRTRNGKGSSRADRDDDELDDEENEGRGNRGRRNDRNERNDSDDRDDEEHTAIRRRRRRESDDESEEQPLTRRRRRHRGSKSEENDNGRDSSRSISRRSRKQQYIDEITDIEGSTRLEAKKQRRRDNRRERSRQNQLIEQDFLARRENVDRLMVVREKGQHTQISVIEDNVLVEHYVSDIQEVATVGNIYLGRVQNVLPSMEAAFVDIGQPRNGVLYAGEVNWDATRLEGQPRRIELAFKSGDPVLVQVTKDPIGHKGARLTSQVTLAGRFLVLVPSGGMTGVSRKLPERERGRLKSIVAKIAPKDMGVIIRTAADGASEDALKKDLENLKRQWSKIEDKRKLYHNGKRAKLLQGEPDVAIRVVRDIFNDDFSKLIVEGDTVYERIEEYLDTMAPDLKDRLEKWDPEEHQGKDVFDKWQIDSQLRKGMERQVYLPSGGSIVIDRTEAMTTIDVNTGRFIGKGKSLEETVTRCNLEASEEIARQLRLRDIGGMIMIDYVDMVMPANRDLVLRRLVECLARDRTKHQVAEVTSLGLVQMTRKRIGQGLVEAFSEECPTCKGRGFILHDEPTISADYADPYAMKGGDPFVHTNKHGHGTTPEVQAPKGSSPAVKAKLAQIAAAAVAANDEDKEESSDSDSASDVGSSADSSADKD
ncbi:Rne/Rng family ribonuclease [Bifidobacterium sp. ESL0745]|uniref:Rne/Rng family ribonuclease n=1 Tax=Bifidobacterium sp. ESL0745 TaxID=2983226 RepID=UPI0023F70711|nr:Rne/Rng family ribonuclease [Bifidobacterium sp. ESL0745]MDF7665607.1 Rne/Rng family ribonuclease [Bifidobacterium sp. ESL0745]